MPRGGGRKPTTAPLPTIEELKADIESLVANLDKDQTPLEYMLAVMNDRTIDLARRDKMAIAAAPYVHAKIGDAGSGKRDKDAAAAKKGASGRYEPPPPPRLVVNG